MNKLKIILMSLALFAVARPAPALHPSWLPQPGFDQTNFLRLPDIQKLNIDYAIQWTDSAASLFVQPFDAVVLHVDVKGKPMDAFIISDIGMQRLAVWLCTEPSATGQRTLKAITAYRGEAGDQFKTPSGLATNAVNRQFDPGKDVIYVADRGNDRIVELAYTPDIYGGKLRYNRSFGQGYLEWPVDVAISAYGDGNPNNADLYVVDWGHERGQGELHRFSIAGLHEGAWHNVYFPGSELAIAELHRPISVACFPDRAKNKSAIYVTEAFNNPLIQMNSATNGDPAYADLYDLDLGEDFWQPGGVALDDYGRVYAANQAKGIIQMFGPNMRYIYDSFGKLGEGPGQLNYPSNLILDTYHGVCEALVVERYSRQAGLQTYLIDNGAAASKPALGFVAVGLVKPPAQTSAGLPGSFVLNEAYPNPFNTQCLITFAIPKESKVTIEVFNILGQEVATLLDEMRQAGEHSVVFNASGISSGVYFYRLSAGDYSETKSMILLK